MYNDTEQVYICSQLGVKSNIKTSFNCSKGIIYYCHVRYCLHVFVSSYNCI